jgi:nicotinamide-nucleotide amidase
MVSPPPIPAPDLYRLAETVGRELLGARWRLVTAESCTGGWIAKALTDVPGSSQWLECGYVTYSNSAKMRDLGVSAATLARDGAVSEATVREMAEGALGVSGAEGAVAVSGIAGPDGGTPGKPVGTVWFAAACAPAHGGQCLCEMRRLLGDRDQVRRQSVEYALGLVLRLVQARGRARGR